MQKNLSMWKVIHNKALLPVLSCKLVIFQNMNVMLYPYGEDISFVASTNDLGKMWIVRIRLQNGRNVIIYLQHKALFASMSWKFSKCFIQR
jgi:hypothetical protein